MKKYLRPFLTGIVVTLIMALVMLKITVDFQILLFLGATVFFVAGLINSNSKNHYLLTTSLITIFYITLFILTVLKQIPELWYFVPIYFAASLLGILFKRNIQKTILSLSLLSLLMLFLATMVIPKNLENSLTKIRFEQHPQFSIQDINGDVINSNNLKGRVVVLDFFATWCKPCLQELKELEKIKTAFKEDDDVVFYIINADIGDTPEKFKRFIEKNNYTFNFAYDHNSQIYKFFKLQQYGVPVLLIIDKEQNIRLQHVGYNTAETNFTQSIIETINSLK